MGYTTEFSGSLQLSRPLSRYEHSELEDLSRSRHSDPMPSVWCDWEPTQDGCAIHWNGKEKFYCYEEWLQLIIDDFLSEWGITLSGTVRYRGERFDDIGTITVDGDQVQKNVCSW